MKSLLIVIYALQFWLLGLRSLQGQDLKFVNYSNGKIYYHVYGQGRPVVLLSGGPGNRCQQIEDVAIALGKHYQTILIEQRGTGLSIPEPMDETTITLKELLADINRVLDDMQLRDAVFFGHSWGGTLAMSFAVTFPERVQSLILVGPGFFDADKVKRTTFDLNGKVRLGEADLDYLNLLIDKQKSMHLTESEINDLRRITYKSYIYDKHKIEPLFEKIKLGVRNAQMYSLIWKNLDNIQFDIKKQLQQISKPVSIITGLQDPLAFVSYELKMIIPNTDMHWIQECGHYPMYEQPEKFYSIIETLMK